MDRACILLLLAVGLLAISAADATEGISEVKYIGQYPCPTLKCSSDGKCPTIACSSAKVIVRAGPNGCAFASTTAISKAISKTAYVQAIKCDEEWKNYCKSNGVVKDKVRIFAESVAKASAKACAFSLTEVCSLWCTCATNSKIYTKATGLAVSFAQAVAYAYSSAIAELKTDTCSDPVFSGKVLAYAAAESVVLVEDIQLAYARVFLEYSKKNKNDCGAKFKEDLETAFAQAFACAITRAVIKTYNDLGENYEYGVVEAKSCSAAIGGTGDLAWLAKFECKNSECKW